MYNEYIFKKLGIGLFLNNMTKDYEEYFKKELDFIKNRVSKNHKVLEVGFGGGRVVKALAPLVKEFWGIDYSRLHMKECKDIKNVHKNVRLFLMDARKIKLTPNSFDTVLMTFSTLSDLGPYKLRVLKQMKRVVKAGGDILIGVYAENAAPYQLDFYSKSGFDEIVKITEDLVNVQNGDGVEIISERFSKDKLRYLFSEAGLDVDIHDLTDFTYMCHAVKMK